MARLATPKTERVSDKRQRRFEDDLDKAGKMKSEAEAVIAAYEKALADARHQAQLTMKETTGQLAALAAERQRQAGAVIPERTTVAGRGLVTSERAAPSGRRGRSRRGVPGASL